MWNEVAKARAAVVILPAVASTLVAASWPAAATSCFGPVEILKEETQQPRTATSIRESKLIVHALVLRRLSERTAEIQVLESFKGAKGLKTMVLTAIPREMSLYPTNFEVGRKYIVMGDPDLVGPCSLMYPYKPLLEYLRRHAEK
jgi:hypothetical protein